MAIPNAPRVSRSVGSDMAELVGRGLMLDVLDQMHDQPDHWVLVAALARRTGLEPAQITPAIAAVVAAGWLETDVTFTARKATAENSAVEKRTGRDGSGVRRVRLTAEGRALFGGHARSHVIERPRARLRMTRRRLGSRHL